MTEPSPTPTFTSREVLPVFGRPLGAVKKSDRAAREESAARDEGDGRDRARVLRVGREQHARAIALERRCSAVFASLHFDDVRRPKIVPTPRPTTPTPISTYEAMRCPEPSEPLSSGVGLSGFAAAALALAASGSTSSDGISTLGVRARSLTSIVVVNGFLPFALASIVCLPGIDRHRRAEHRGVEHVAVELHLGVLLLAHDGEPDEARLELVGALLRGLLAIGTTEPLRERDRLVEARPRARELTALLVAVGEVQQRADARARACGSRRASDTPRSSASRRSACALPGRATPPRPRCLRSARRACVTRRGREQSRAGQNERRCTSAQAALLIE